MRLLSLLSVVLATAALSPAALADGRKPGSKLYYPALRSGGAMFSIVCLSNTNTRPATPASFGGSTNVHFEYYNVVPGTDPCRPRDCVIFDRVEFLTPADTLCVLTACHNATTANGQQGYLVVTAQDPERFDADWCFNHLIGSVMTSTASGAVYSSNAIPRLCEPLNEGGDVAYEPVPTGGTFEFIASPTAYLGLISVSPQPTDIRSLLFEVWNDNEFPLSTTKQFNCWFEQPLAAISPLFTTAFLRSTPHDPQELDLNCDGVGDLETGWVRVTSVGLQTQGGDPVGGGAPAAPLGLLNDCECTTDEECHCNPIPRIDDGIYGWTIFELANSGGMRLLNELDDDVTRF